MGENPHIQRTAFNVSWLVPHETVAVPSRSSGAVSNWVETCFPWSPVSEAVTG